MCGCENSHSELATVGQKVVRGVCVSVSVSVSVCLCVRARARMHACVRVHHRLDECASSPRHFEAWAQSRA